MFYVYLLKDKISGKIYTGYTANLKQRYSQHINKGVITTSKFAAIELIFYEAFVNKQDAQRREKYLKTTKGKRAIKIMLTSTLGPIV